MAAPGAKFALDKSQLADLLFAAERVDDLARVIAAVGRLQPATSIDQLSKAVAKEETGITPEEAERLLEVVLGYLATRETGKFTPQQMVDGIRQELAEKRQALRQPDAEEVWAKGEEKFRKAVELIPSDHPLHVLGKVTRVVYAHQNVLTGMRIITDLRPVFDESGERILHSVVSHKLIVTYHDGLRGRRLEFGVDATDLAEMRRLAERALVKGVTLQKALNGKPWSVALKIDHE
jgi:hypothetical protein